MENALSPLAHTAPHRGTGIWQRDPNEPTLDLQRVAAQVMDPAPFALVASLAMDVVPVKKARR